MRVIALALILAVRLEAAPQACADLCGHDAVRGYGYLLASTGFTGEVEHAAFVVRDGDGAIHFVRWNTSDEYRARYRGPVPAGCIAIAHTHPHYQRNPSPRDIDEARRTQIPILVITPDAITIANADGSVDTLFGAHWTKR